MSPDATRRIVGGIGPAVLKYPEIFGRLHSGRPGGRSRFKNKMAVEELLRGSDRRKMQLRHALDKPKTRAELRLKRVGVVPHHIEAAALGRTFWTEGAHDDVSA